MKSCAVCVFSVTFPSTGHSADFAFMDFYGSGQDEALTKTINTLESMNKKEEVKELQTKCRKGEINLYFEERTQYTNHCVSSPFKCVGVMQFRAEPNFLFFTNEEYI